MEEIKPKYRIELSNTAWFKYYIVETGAYRGIWDAYKPNKKHNHTSDISCMPKDFHHEIGQRILLDRERNGWGRKLKAVAFSIWAAGIICGWQPKIETHDVGDLIFWEQVNPEGKTKAEFVFAVLHCRWLHNPEMTVPLLSSRGFLRFVVDNGGKLRIWGMNKKDL